MARAIDGNWLYEKVEARYRVSTGIEHRCERDFLDLICNAPTLTPPNEPLTLEQLREMVGQWVWVVVTYERCTCDGWALVTTPAFLSYLDQTLPIDFYGRKFTAYRRPLEGEGNA